MALSKQKIKFIRSLEIKKNRTLHHVFLAEGGKLVEDILSVFKCKLLCATSSWLEAHPFFNAEDIITVSEEELKRISFLKTPKDVLAVFYQPDRDLEKANFSHQLLLVSDGIQDPGNLGALMRVADWFGIEHIVCSSDTVDVFNPKTVQSTMGALARVRVSYVPLASWLKDMEGLPVYGTFLEGEDLYEGKLSENGIIIMGNEGNGIRPEIASLVNRKLYIPNYPLARETSESLNVAVAAGIVCAEFRRRAR
ncbi:MAG: RNA methyltransferase [Candidatus Azobacteroides sp.]|nr:RNA methyltransferase [Candidatus Azobacteroides sp.]